MSGTLGKICMVIIYINVDYTTINVANNGHYIITINANISTEYFKIFLYSFSKHFLS